MIGFISFVDVDPVIKVAIRVSNSSKRPLANGRIRVSSTPFSFSFIVPSLNLLRRLLTSTVSSITSSLVTGGTKIGTVSVCKVPGEVRSRKVSIVSSAFSSGNSRSIRSGERAA